MSIEAPVITTTPARLGLNLDKSSWTRVRFGEVAQASKEKVDPSLGDVGRYIAGEHMDTDDLRIHRWGEVGEGYLGPAFHRRFRPGQVLYGSRRTYLRKVSVAEFEGVCANTTFVVESKNNEVLLQEFLPFVMSSEPFHSFAIQESKGSVNPYVNWSDIALYEFTLPPLDEQKRLADLLWSLERHRRATIQSKACTDLAFRTVIDQHVDRLIKQSSMPFAEFWERSPESGWSAPPVDHATGRYVLSLAALGDEGYRRGKLKAIPESDKARAATLRYGDLLISRANTADKVGRIGFFDEDRSDVSFPDTMMRLRIRQSIDPHFVEAVISSTHGREYMRRAAAGSATSMVKINRQSLGRLSFPEPEPATQRALVRLKREQKSVIDTIGDELYDLTALRAALLAEIFEEAD